MGRREEGGAAFTNINIMTFHDQSMIFLLFYAFLVFVFVLLLLKLGINARENSAGVPESGSCQFLLGESRRVRLGNNILCVFVPFLLAR